MDNPEERTEHIISLPDEGEIADELFKQGKISNMQAAQIKMWATAKPDKNASRAKFEAWMKMRPFDVPGLWPPDPPPDRPLTMDNSEEKTEPIISLPAIDDIADELFKQGKISNMQAAQIKLWATAKPDKNASRAKFEAWMKSQPVDIPDLWQYRK
jgi:polyhydroxyalkanoate synthesis regulator phasin